MIVMWLRYASFLLVILYATIRLGKLSTSEIKDSILFSIKVIILNSALITIMYFLYKFCNLSVNILTWVVLLESYFILFKNYIGLFFDEILELDHVFKKMIRYLLNDLKKGTSPKKMHLTGGKENFSSCKESFKSNDIHFMEKDNNSGEGSSLKSILKSNSGEENSSKKSLKSKHVHFLEDSPSPSSSLNPESRSLKYIAKDNPFSDENTSIPELTDPHLFDHIKAKKNTDSETLELIDYYNNLTDESLVSLTDLNIKYQETSCNDNNGENSAKLLEDIHKEIIAKINTILENRELVEHWTSELDSKDSNDSDDSNDSESSNDSDDSDDSDRSELSYKKRPAVSDTSGSASTENEMDLYSIFETAIKIFDDDEEEVTKERSDNENKKTENTESPSESDTKTESGSVLESSSASTQKRNREDSDDSENEHPNKKVCSQSSTQKRNREDSDDSENEHPNKKVCSQSSSSIISRDDNSKGKKRADR